MKITAYSFLLFICIISLTGLSSCEFTSKDILTPKERKWLNQHPNVKIAVGTVFPPFQFTNKAGQVQGISVDFLKLIEKKINYQFDKVYFDNWDATLKAGKNRKVDSILEIQENTERKEHFIFTKTFLSIPHVIIMRTNSSDQISIDDLENLRVGVVKSYAVHQYLSNFFPSIRLVPLENDITCLRALAVQKVDAVITQQGVALYLIQKEVISNLHIVGNAGYDNELGFAVRKDWPILARIIDKGLARISQKEHRTIFNYWISPTLSPFWEQGLFWLILLILFSAFGITLVSIYFWNKTLRKRVEVKTYQLKKSKEKAEESNQLKSSFLANISHEIRTPLNAIQGFTELLIKENLDLQKKKEYAQIVNINCKSLTNLIDEILDLSRIESGQIKIQDQVFDLIPLLEEVVKVQTQNIPDLKQIEIQFVNQLNTYSFKMTGDPFRFRQVINNLVSNAIKFTNHGKIQLFASFNSDKEILFCVEDTGIGIEEASLHFIFDRFTKIEGDSSILYRGSGLGLNICKKLLGLMGGEIWVKSKPGKGSAFYFTLPTEL